MAGILCGAVVEMPVYGVSTLLLALSHSMVVGVPEWAYRNGNENLPHFRQSLRSHSIPCPLRSATWERVTQTSPQSSRRELDFTLEDVLKRL